MADPIEPVVDVDSRPEGDEPKGLDAALSSALEDFGTEPAAAAPVEGRARDEAGRFAPKSPDAEGSTAAAEVAPDVVSQPPVANAQAAQTPVAPAWTDGHFTGWKPDQREKFSKLPPDVQALVMERQTESQAFYQRKISEADEYRKQFQPLQEAAREVAPLAQAAGMQPHELMRAYASHENTLKYGTLAQKVDLVNRICANYAIPLQPQAEPDPFADPLSPNGQAYPVVHDLQSQLRQTQAELQGFKSQLEMQQTSRVQSELQSFAAAKDAAGQPLYPWFEHLKPVMGQIMSSGKAETLADAYAMAAKPFEDKVKAEAEARQKAAEAEQAKVIARARKAGPIRSSGVTPNGAAKGAGLDHLLDASLTSAGFN